MKWRRYATSLKLGKLFKGLMLLALMKLALFGSMLWEMRPDQAPAPVAKAKAMETGRSLAASMLATNSAMAAAANATSQSQPTQPAPAAKPAQAAAPAAMPIDREGMLKRQDDLNRRELALKTLEQELDAKLVKLQEYETKIKRMLEEANAVKDKKLAHLIDVYQNMKAKQAAQVLETLDEKTAVKILAGMSGRQAGEILQNVKADKAAKLTEALTRLQTSQQ